MVTNRLMATIVVALIHPKHSEVHQMGQSVVHFGASLYLLGQWLNFKFFGITYLVGKISRSNFYSRAQDGYVSIRRTSINGDFEEEQK